LLTLRADATAACHEHRQLQQHVSSLQHERSEQGRAMSELQQQLGDLREQQRQDRATLATMLRQHQEREAQLQEVRAAVAQRQVVCVCARSPCTHTCIHKERGAVYSADINAFAQAAAGPYN
jgi:septal ring factor EnvC (AmiA/AmiB activator)